MAVPTILAIMILAMAPAGSAMAQEPGGFGAEMRERLTTRMAGASVAADPNDPLSVIVKRGESEESTVNFHRIHSYCQTAAASDCETLKQEFIDKIAKKVPEPTVAGLRLIVRDTQYLSHATSLKTELTLVYSEQIGDDLHVLLAVDTPDAIALVGAESLKKLGMTRDQAWARAAAQTRAILPALPTKARLSKQAVGYEGEGYLGSLLIDRAGWSGVAEAVGSDLFVTVVSDQFVFVAMMPDGPKLDAFKRTVAEDCAAQVRCISPNVYRFRSGKWTIAR
ncbi:hypothetical protein [Sphingomonas koreensis]